MRQIRVELGARSYEIVVGTGVLTARHLAPLKGAATLMISDSNVDPQYGPAVERVLRGLGGNVQRTVIPAGESSKTLAVVGRLYAAAAAAGLDRSSWIVALGGGVVGDVAGFVAATYLRGIRLLQIPTSLLAMVDSSVGGKTGINLSQGKNLVGAFYQPAAVLADLALLDTLPEREYISGLAEVVKYGIIREVELLGLLEERAAAIRAREKECLELIVARCCEIKAAVVGADERESSLRAILNFGHTIGHALEKAAGYGRWLHGEAVAMGMGYALALSVRQRGLPRAESERIVRLLERLGLSAQWPAADPKITWRKVRRAIGSDKKTLRATPRFVLIERLGETMTGCEAPEEILTEVWNVSGK